MTISYSETMHYLLYVILPSISAIKFESSVFMITQLDFAWHSLNFKSKFTLAFSISIPTLLPSLKRLSSRFVTAKVWFSLEYYWYLVLLKHLIHIGHACFFFLNINLSIRIFKTRYPASFCLILPYPWTIYMHAKLKYRIRQQTDTA